MQRSATVLAILLAVFAGAQTVNGAVRDFGYFGDGAGWLLSDEALLLRTHGAWQSIEPLGLPSSAILSARFGDAEHGWILVDVPFLTPELQIATTSDGGRTWSMAPLPLGAGGNDFAQAEFGIADAQHAWLLLRKSTSLAFSVARLFGTSDGGLHWEELPEPPAFGRLRFTSPSDGWLAGGVAMRQLWHSGDGGQTWQEALHAGTGSFQGAPVFAGKRGAVLIGVSSDDRRMDDVMVTNDGGATWTRSERVERDAAAIERTSAEPVSLNAPVPMTNAIAARTEVAGWSAAVADFARRDDGWLFERSTNCERSSSHCVDLQTLRQYGNGEWSDVTPESERSHWFTTPSPLVYSNGDGFDTDKQNLLTVQQMASLRGSGFSVTYASRNYTGTYSNMGVYLGGASVGAVPPTTSWLQQVSSQGWGFLPLWVPSQAPCTGFKARLSYSDDPVAKGTTEGNQAVSTASAFGFPSGTILWVDIEAFVNIQGLSCTTTDQTIMKRFVNALFGRIRANGYTAGLYTSASNGPFWTTVDSNLTSAPDALWLAYWGRARFDMGSYMTAGWYQSRRAHQFANIANAVYGYNADYDAVDGQVASVGAGPATVTINSASATPQTTPTTSTFSIQYNVTASAATTVMLGASLRLNGTSTWSISDPPHDTAVSLASGNNTVSRQFSVSAAAGTYDLLVAVWRDQNGNGAIDGADQQLSSLTVLNAVTLSNASSCKSLTLLRNPSNGGSIGANPTASVPCNIGFYLSSTPITLTAMPASGYQFTGWSGSGFLHPEPDADGLYDHLRCAGDRDVHGDSCRLYLCPCIVLRYG